jgi:acetyl-CoA carboxylase biotin carboxyl carrier protein
MSTDLPLTPEDVAEIVAILDGSGYEKFEIRTARFALKVARSGAGWTQEWDWSPATTANPPMSGEVETRSGASAGVSTSLDTNGSEEAKEGEADPGVAVLPPLPGTFYRAPQPGAPPFVEVGDTVGPETVVGIVETMKLMNPVHAGTSGRIAAILVDNATLIDGQSVIMRIVPEPA